ncbi:MAG: cobalamin-binding protein [Planctomycetota bacterium]|nr:MAG: cobalamin-binding protein [Planctomycetota bacterium]
MAGAERVVTLTCSHTEIVAALGCGDRIVGCDADSDQPAELVASLPRVGRDLGVDPEKVAALDPDLVLASLTVPGHEKVVARLEAKGLPFVVTQPVSLADVYADIRQVAGLLAVEERGERLVQEMQQAMPAVERSEKDRPSLLVSWWPSPVIGAGRRSWVHDLIELAGGRNANEDCQKESAPLSAEQICALAPEHFVISWCGVPAAKYRPELVLEDLALAEVPAVRRGAVHCVSEAWLGRPGPNLIHGYHALRQLLG